MLRYTAPTLVLEFLVELSVLVVLFDEVVCEALFASLASFLVFVSFLLDNEPLPVCFELYPSEYQPLPLRMKFPFVIIRCAFFFPHFGHFSMGGSLIRCSISYSLRQDSQRYVYVGILLSFISLQLKLIGASVK